MTQRESARTPGKTPPWDDGAGDDGPTFGQWLRRQREVREITLREIADATKISLRYLQAFESDDFDALPASVFARGFLRQFAAYVGLDPDEAVNSFLQAMPDEDGLREGAQDELQTVGGSDTQRLWLVGTIVVLLVLVVVLATLWFRSRGAAGGGNPAADAVTEAPSTPVPIGSPAAAVVTPDRPPTTLVTASENSGDDDSGEGAPLVVTLEFSEECWVELEVDGGTSYVSELHVQGESLRVEARQRVRILTLGNPGGVRVEVNGRPWELPETPAGSVLHEVDIERPVQTEDEGAPSASPAAE